MVLDTLFYIDATSGINANFETGIVSDDGFGGVDTVLNFERVYGSYHDDIVQLSHDIYRGYTPLYGNDTIKGPSTQEIVNNSYVGYWNLVDADTEYKSEADPNVTEAHIVFNFDAGTVDKYITGGVYDIKVDGEADYQDTFSGAIEGVIGSRGSDIIYGHSTEGKSTIIDGERTWYYGWLNGNHGDDTIVALGSGDDKLQGGGGDDILIVKGSGELDQVFGHGTRKDYPNLVDTDTDTFVIGGTGHVYLADYEFGEEIILLDYVIGSAADFTTSYDFSTDYTAVTFKDGADTLDDRIFIKGNVKVAGTESTTFTNAALDGSSDKTLNNETADTRLILERSTDVPAETIIGGEGDDYIIGEGGAEQIRTGGGNDTVFAGGGDDLVVVQGQGDSTVDTGTGDDKVVVSNDWSGTLLLKNGAGADDGVGSSLEIQKEIRGSGAVNDTDMFITFSDGSQITVEDYYSVDAEGYYSVNDSSFQSVRIGGWDGYEKYRDGTVDWVVGTANSDKLYSSAINDTAEAGIIYSLSGRGGDDILYSGGGNNSIWGGEGDDTFYLSGDAQQTIIGGDKESSGQQVVRASCQSLLARILVFQTVYI